MTMGADPRVRVFVDLFNIYYPDWDAPGDTDELKPEHVDFNDNLSGNWGRCGSRSDGTIVYKINRQKWIDWDVNRRLMLIIHELGHVEHAHHKPSFWGEVIDIYYTFKEREDEVDEAIAGDIDWTQVAKHLTRDPNSSTVDRRCETVNERRQMMADALDYDGYVPSY